MVSASQSISLPVVGLVLLGAYLFSLGTTHLARRYAHAFNVLDVPNARSSHSFPVARGGGVGIVLVTLGYCGLAASLGWLEANTAWAIGGGLLIAGIGWRDDHKPVSSWIRFVVQLFACTWAVYWLGGSRLWHFGEYAVDLGWLGSVMAVIVIAWLANLFNFMDGIDGFAGMEGAFVLGSGGMLAFTTGSFDIGLAALVAACSCLGFLTLNWPPAKIFMGDVGSAFLGFLVGVLAFSSEPGDAAGFLPWLLLAGVFVADATLTLLRRIVRGERWYAAHRSHAYQLLVQSGWSHQRVTIFALGINLLVPFPLAVATWIWPAEAPWFAVVAVVLLSAVWVIVHAMVVKHTRLETP